MKRKIIAGFMLLLLAFSFGCSKNEEVKEPQEGSSIGSDGEEEESAGPNVDKNLLSVEVTLPPDMAGDLSGFDREAYLKENPDFSDAKVMEDGSLWIKMSRGKHKEMMEEMSESIKESFNDLIEGEDTPYIKDIRTNNGYKEVEVYVDRAGYENAFDYSGFTILLSVGFYQTFQGEEVELHLKYVDADTEEIIEESFLPEE